MKTSSLRARGLACALLATTAYCGLTAQPAAAQAAQKHRQVDANGVDVTHGDFLMNLVEGSIGSGDAELALVRIGAWYPDSQDMQGHLWERIQFKQIPVSGGGTRYTVMLGTRLETFNGTGTLPSGSSLSGSGSAFTYTTADGTKIEFTDPSGGTPNPNSQYCNGTQATCSLLPTSLISPDGKILAIGWDIFTQCWGMIEAENIPCNHFGRVASVSNSYGYEIRFAYDPNEGSGVDSPPSSSWYRRTGAGLYNNAVSTSVPQASVSYSYPSSGVTQVTDIGGRVWRITGVGGRVTAIRRPGAASDTTIIGYDGAVVSSVTADGVTTGYSRSVSGSTATMTITNALSQVSSVVSDMTIGRPTSVTDPLSRTTGFQYDSSGRLTRVTAPEGNYVEYSYDTRGNVTRTRSVAKSGSGLSDIVISASYDLTCSNPLTCNQPNSTTDARGNATHYKYNPTHGGVERVTGPAVGTVSPQTRYSYTLVNGEYRLTGVSQCQSGQEGTDTVPTTCPGTPDEVKSILTYDSNGNLITTTTGNGSNTLTASVIMTYDALGNRLTVDGPLPGSDDTTRFRYNSGRQPIGSVSPDPDGSGALKHRAVRNVIDGATGLLTRTETGAVNSQSDTDWAGFTPIQAAETDYDSNARPVKQRLTAGGTIHALTQTSYDALGRPECVAQRMNKAIFATISTGACSLGSQGSGADDFGPDRIVKTVYDAAGQVTQVRTAVGTSLEAAEATMAYRDNGQAEYLIDANGNRTQYVYDGHDRPSQTRYPSPTGPSSPFDDSTAADALATAGSVNINDYEEQGYDAAGNVASFRNRANATIAFTYDALGRVSLKDLPGSEPDVSFAYDNLGRVTSASQSGSSLTFTWDALGRKLTEAGSHGTLTSTWDIAGRRTRLAHPDGAYFDHAYLVTGELVSITEGGTSTPGAVATFAYDDLGRRITLTRGNGTSTSYAYDAVSRLQSLGHSFPAASSNNLTLGFAYNPASQIVTNTRSNDLYSWTGHGSGSLSSPANGLNQIISLDGAAITHDTKGNLTSEGGRSFSYSSENLLTGFTGPTHTHVFRYDPLMRLRQMETPNILRRHHIRDGDDLVREYNDNTLVGRHVHGPGADEPLYTYRASNGRRWWYHADERGSIVAASFSDRTRDADIGACSGALTLLRHHPPYRDQRSKCRGNSLGVRRGAHRTVHA